MLVTTDPSSELGRRALRAYMEDVASRYRGRPATDAEVEAALRDEPSDDLRPPHGLLVVALVEDEPVGCGGVRFLGDGIAELTRVHVAPAARRRGLGERIVRHLEEQAREEGRTCMRLDTRSDLVEARALYERLGYREVAPFNDGPYAEHWFAKRLDAHTEEATGWGGALWAAADLLTPMAIRVAATLRLADHIAAGTRTAEALAAVVRADADALGRVMGHLVTAGVLSRTDDGAYGLTALGEQLRDDDPGGVRPWLDLEGAIGRADLCFAELLHTVRTGEPAFPRRFGRAFWDDLSADPGLAASFDALMGARLAADAPVVAAAYPWGTLGHVVDVGGGDGSLLVALLRAHPGLRGTVIDLDGPVARARLAIAAAGLEQRADAAAGSFFDALPAGAGGYVLSGILHDWDDEHALRILRRCAEAAAGTGKVLVVDHAGGAPSTEGDLRMLCYVRGRERTLDQLGALARSAGLRPGSVTPAGSRAIVELISEREGGR